MMKTLKNKTILIGTLVAYLCIVLSSEKLDILMIEALPVSIIGVYDFFTLALPLSGFLGVAIIMIVISSSNQRPVYKNKLLFAGLILLLIPLIIFQSWENSIAIEAERGWYLFLPEIFFFAGFVMIVRKIFTDSAKKKQ